MDQTPMESILPLAGVRVVDFTTLLPGPLATLILAETGAEVLKIERPDFGDEMRQRSPAFGKDSGVFALLNRGKRSLVLDLKKAQELERLYSLLGTADVLVEQFRPGVMERLGLGYDKVQQINPQIIYCSITGYGQSGDRANVPGHDLNYLAESGLLSLVCRQDGAPALPCGLIADIAGGAYPAVMNILFAILQRAKSGKGCRLDLAMARNILPFLYWAIARGTISGIWPTPGGEEMTGGSPRYQIYRTRDDKFLAVAALEDRFWNKFCELIEMPEAMRVRSCQPESVRDAVANLIVGRTAAEWERVFSGHDVCCSVVRTVSEAIADPNLLDHEAAPRYVTAGSAHIPALPLPLDPNIRDTATTVSYPYLGEATQTFLRFGNPKAKKEKRETSGDTT